MASFNSKPDLPPQSLWSWRVCWGPGLSLEEFWSLCLRATCFSPVTASDPQLESDCSSGDMAKTLHSGSHSICIRSPHVTPSLPQQSTEPATSLASPASQGGELASIGVKPAPAGWTPKHMAGFLQHPAQLFLGTGQGRPSLNSSILNQSMVSYLDMPIMPAIILDDRHIHMYIHR